MDENNKEYQRIMKELSNVEKMMDELKLAQYKKNDLWQCIACAYSWGRILSEEGATQDQHQEMVWRIANNKAIN